MYLLELDETDIKRQSVLRQCNSVGGFYLKISTVPLFYNKIRNFTM